MIRQLIIIAIFEGKISTTQPPEIYFRLPSKFRHYMEKNIKGYLYKDSENVDLQLDGDGIVIIIDNSYAIISSGVYGSSIGVEATFDLKGNEFIKAFWGT